jgi:DNA ligase 1
MMLRLLLVLILTLSGMARSPAQTVLLAETLSWPLPESFDPKPYLVSEKLDGIRATWDGRELKTRSGSLLHPPRWFRAQLPAHALDGELWLGRGQFEALSSAVRGSDPEAWRAVRYCVFELPGATGSFRARAERIATLVAKANAQGDGVLCEVPQRQFATRAALALEFERVRASGGEGLMLHWADSDYHTGRSSALLKLKAWEDMEGVVIEHLPGKGRLVGALGALRVRLPNGRELRLGSGFSDAERRAPPDLGSSVSFRYRGYTRTGLPRFAVFLRVRPPE